MRRSIPPVAVAAALAIAVLGPHAVLAEGPATMHGLVYSCENRLPIASAHVTLRGIDDGTVRELTTDTAGRFVRIGLTPGRYLIVASAGGRGLHPAVSSRMAMLDNDDNLTMRIGTYTAGSSYSGYQSTSIRQEARDPYTQATPACDAPLVPLAHSTANRYVIR
jgi:hypothetical protein